MRIHSDTIDGPSIERAAKAAGARVARITEHRSSIRARAFEVFLTGHGKHGGQWGNSTGIKTASWDEWGMVLGELYDTELADPGRQMVVGNPGSPVYADRDNFHARTDGRFQFKYGITPDEAHHNHKWQYVGRSPHSVWGWGILARCKGTKGKPCTARTWTPA